MKPAHALMFTAAAALLVVSRDAGASNIEPGEGDYLGGIGAGNVVGTIGDVINVMTEEAAMVDDSTAARNIAAWLDVLMMAEGTKGRGDYRACYGYRHTIRSLADHPAVTREWMGERLPDEMCINAGFKPGCVSTAAGAFQIIKPTWLECQAALGLPDFGADSQRAAAIHLTAGHGALEDVKAGRIDAAARKCRRRWASLPGNYAKQGQRPIETLMAWFTQAGGTLA